MEKEPEHTRFYEPPIRDLVSKTPWRITAMSPIWDLWPILIPFIAIASAFLYWRST